MKRQGQSGPDSQCAFLSPNLTLKSRRKDASPGDAGLLWGRPNESRGGRDREFDKRDGASCPLSSCKASDQPRADARLLQGRCVMENVALAEPGVHLSIWVLFLQA